MSIRRTADGRSEQEARAAALADALRAAGIPCRVEARAALAVLFAEDGGAALATPEARRRALALAREQGFTHVALEV